MKYLLVLFFAIVYEIDASCPNGTFPNYTKDKCYFIPKDSNQSLFAETSCQDQNGNLASISDSHDNYYLRAANIKPQKSQPLKTGRKPSDANYLDMAKKILGSNVTYAWLGGRKEKNGTWIWLDGQNFSYKNWVRGNPKNNTYENCMSLRLSNAQWYSFSCYNILPYICELSQTTTTITNSPSTTIISTTTNPTALTNTTTITNSSFTTITSTTTNPTVPTTTTTTTNISSTTIISTKTNPTAPTTTITNTSSTTITSTTTNPTALTNTTTITNSSFTTITSTTTNPTVPTTTTTITNSPSTTITSTATNPTVPTTTITNTSSTTITSTTTNPTAPTTTFTPLSTTDPKHSNYRNLLIFSCVGIFIFIFTAFMLIYCILRYRRKKRRTFRPAIEMQVQSTRKGKPKELKKLDNFWTEEKRLEVKYDEPLGTGFNSNIYN